MNATKKVIALGLALVMLATIFTSCTKKEAVDTETGETVSQSDENTVNEEATDEDTTAEESQSEEETSSVAEPVQTEPTTKKTTSTSKTETTTKKSNSSSGSSGGSSKTTTTTNPWSDIHFLSYDEVKWAVDEAIKYAKSQGCYIDTTMTTDGHYYEGKWTTSVGYRAGTDTATAITWGNCRTKEGFLQSIKWDIDECVEAGKKADEDHKKLFEMHPELGTYEPKEYWAHINVYLAYGDALTRHGLDTKNADGSTRYIAYVVYG